MAEKRFCNNMQLELALRTLFGNKYYHFAECGQDPKEIKKAMKDWIKKIENRIDELTNYDLRLKEVSESLLEELKIDISQLEKKNNDWIIISRLIQLISYLLGFDFVDGEIYRHVLFFQDKTQEVGIAQKEGKLPAEEFNWIFRNRNNCRRKIAKQLKNEGLTIFKISEIMNIRQTMVRKLLKEE